MSQPSLDSTTIGTNTTNITTSQLDSNHIGTRTQYPTPLTRPMDSSKRKGKLHVPEDPESDPSLSDSSSNESDLSDNSKYSKSKSKGRDTNKKRWKCMKQESSYSSSSNSDFSDEGDYIGKRCKNNNIRRKKVPIE